MSACWGVRAPAFLLVLSVACLGCASEFNTVRLQRSAGSEILTLRTQHYLRTDDNHVQELERGERRAEIKASKTKTPDGTTPVTLSIALRLYDDDPMPGVALQLAGGEVAATVTVTAWQVRELREKVTVLDTGQRAHNNAALTSEVQAQTGYITFGKPTAAGAVARAWKVYSADALANDRVLAALQNGQGLKMLIPLGSWQAQIEFKPDELKAWQRFVKGQIDKVVD